MPNPKEVFNTPHHYFDFLTASKDDDFEGQYFDRKEASRAGQDIKNLKKQLVETISAFANENKAGGLLVLGISKSGELKGIEHLLEEQINC